MSYTIAPIHTSILPSFWPVVGPLLALGASVDDDTDLEAELANILSERARIWFIAQKDKIEAAFVTRVICDENGRALDVFGLGGANMAKWGKDLTGTMVAYSRLAECKRIIFKGRKALLRTYPGVKIIGRDDDGTYIFEKALKA